MTPTEEMFAFETAVKDEHIDCLDRQEFIEQLINVVEALSKNKLSACYAINGEWGSGKSFVLDKFEKQIARIGQEGTTLDKYIVFHYNCWQYDFYEEPLIAIVASVLEQLKTKAQVTACDKYGDKLNKVAAGLQLAGLCIWGITKNKIKDTTGFDPEELYSSIKDANGIATNFANHKDDSHKFDVYFDFKKILKNISELFEQLAKDQMIIFVVDELDRCLPEYTIKVLERLHHIFEDIPNIQVILAVDKQQLENTVRQIYGDKISVGQYLEKFINFELKLEVGEVSEKMMKEVYEKYFKSFSYKETDAADVCEICELLLKGVDVRKCKVIIEKSFLCHRLLNPDGQALDGVYLSIEIFLTLLKQLGLNPKIAKEHFNIDHLFTAKNYGESYDIFSATSQVLPGLAVLSDQWHKTIKSGQEVVNCYLLPGNNHRFYINTFDLYGVLLGCYRIILGFTNDVWDHRIISNCSNSSPYDNQEKISQYTRKFWGFLKILN